MSKTYITFGVDVSAYATIEVPANTQKVADPEAIRPQFPSN